MIVTDYRGLTVTQVAEVRRSLREAGATFHVAKNTLARIAAKQAEQPDLIALLEGPTAIAFVADDPAAAAKKLSEIARQTRILEVRGAAHGGPDAVGRRRPRAGRPARRRTCSRPRWSARSPARVQGAYNVLAAPLREFLVVLDQYIEKRQAAEAA